MNSILCIYDLPEDLKIANPAAYFRRFGRALNKSGFVFPCNRVPVAKVEQLAMAGASIHTIEFAEQSQEKLLELVKVEMRRDLRRATLFVETRSTEVKNLLDQCARIADEGVTDDEWKAYRKWRSVLSRGKRELLAAQECAMGFGISRDVEEGISSLRNLLAAELSLSLAWRDKLNGQPKFQTADASETACRPLEAVS